MGIVMSEKSSFIKKHAKTSEEIKKDIQQMEKAKEQYTQDVSALEANLKSFNEALDPLVNPANDEVLCWIRRPSQSEWEQLVPPELMKYRELETIPAEVLAKYTDQQFEMMAKLIEKPKHDAKWWKEHANLIFQELFQIHLIDVYRKLGIAVENF